MQMAPQQTPEKVWVLLIFLEGNTMIGYDMESESHAREALASLREAMRLRFDLHTIPLKDDGSVVVRPDKILATEIQKREKQAPPDPYEALRHMMIATANPYPNPDAVEDEDDDDDGKAGPS